MKFKTLSSAALVAAIALGTLSPIAASAVATQLDSTGTVTVEEGKAGGIDTPTVDPEDPSKPLPKPDVPETEVTNPDLGSLVIEKTTNLDFGKISTSANDVTAFAKPMAFTGGTVTRGAYVQWADVRAGGTYGYSVTAELSKQFTGKKDVGNVLTASTIGFSNGMAVAQDGNTNIAPSVVQTGFELAFGTGAKTVVNAKADTKEGKGRYVIEFGQSDTSTTGTPGTADKSVKLTVPAATASNMAVDDYTATVTWKIVAAI